MTIDRIGVMTGSTSRLANLRAVSSIVSLLSVVTGVTVAIIGLSRADAGPRVWLVAGGVVVILGGLFVLIATTLLFKIESNTFRSYGQLMDMHELAKSERVLLENIAESAALSDAAKALANREKDCESLRTAIRAELRVEQWDAALALVDGMAQRFGYVEEAESLRAEITDARLATMRRRFDQAQALIQSHLQSHEWDKALGEIERLQRALPDEPRIVKLRALYESSRAARKAELRKAWNGAVERNDVDEAIETLRELDQYLTREEARTLEESARGVFKAKLLQLGMQFQFAVGEQRWRDAIEIGLQIMDEFPNARMSKEVSEAMEGLRARAGLHADVDVTAGDSAKVRPPQR